MILLQMDSSETLEKYFEVSPESVLGLLVGGMALIIAYLIYENRQLKNKVDELTDKLIELTTTLIEKLSDIKTGIEKHSITVGNKVDNLIRWIKTSLRPKKDT